MTLDSLTLDDLNNLTLEDLDLLFLQSVSVKTIAANEVKNGAITIGLPGRRFVRIDPIINSNSELDPLTARLNDRLDDRTYYSD